MRTVAYKWALSRATVCSRRRNRLRTLPSRVRERRTWEDSSETMRWRTTTMMMIKANRMGRVREIGGGMRSIGLTKFSNLSVLFISSIDSKPPLLYMANLLALFFSLSLFLSVSFISVSFISVFVYISLSLIHIHTNTHTHTHKQTNKQTNTQAVIKMG